MNPKGHDMKVVRYFWPTGLIVFQYNIIGKILTNRLAKVITSVVTLEQSTFVKVKWILRWYIHFKRNHFFVQGAKQATHDLQCRFEVSLQLTFL